jgi:kinesin family protein C2/C3
MAAAVLFPAIRHQPSGLIKLLLLLYVQVDTLRMREELDGLRDLEDRYKRVVEENRTLYNTVQDLRGNIRVFCR